MTQGDASGLPPRLVADDARHGVDRFYHTYGFVFVLLIATIVVTGGFGDTAAGAVISILLLGACLIMTLLVSEVPARIVRLAVWVTVIVAVPAVIAGLAGHSQSIRGLPALAGVIFIVGSPAAILWNIRHHSEISMKTVTGAVCVYLFLGMFFSMLYRVVGSVWPPFFVQTDTVKLTDCLYFSYVTLATVGYGDLTAAGQVDRMLAVSEALIGQIYLVTIVALLVSNLGRKRQRPEA